jgi:hypothetical protein
MEYAIRFEEGNHLVTATASGSSDVAAQMALYKDVVGDPRYAAGTPILLDYSALDERRASSAEVKRLGRFIASLDEALGDAKLAVVVPDTVAYGLGRMSQAHIDTSREIRFIYDRPEAEIWLQE